MKDTRTGLVWAGTILAAVGLIFGLVLALHSVQNPNRAPQHGAGGSTSTAAGPTPKHTPGNQAHGPTPQPVTVVLPSSVAIVVSNDSGGGSSWLGPLSGIIIALCGVVAVALPMTLRSRDRMASEREQLVQLAGLRDRGILSDEEFTAKKNELLSKIGLDTRADGRPVNGSANTTGT